MTVKQVAIKSSRSVSYANNIGTKVDGSSFLGVSTCILGCIEVFRLCSGDKWFGFQIAVGFALLDTRCVLWDAFMDVRNFIVRFSCQSGWKWYKNDFKRNGGLQG